MLTLWTDDKAITMLLWLLMSQHLLVCTLPGPVHGWFVAVLLARGMACIGAAESQ